MDGATGASGTRARAEGEHARIRQVEELTNGGQVIEERTEETFNEKTGTGAATSRCSTGWTSSPRRAPIRPRPRAPGPRRARAGKGMDCLEIVQQAYERSHTRAPDPRALSPAS